MFFQNVLDVKLFFSCTSTSAFSFLQNGSFCSAIAFFLLSVHSFKVWLTACHCGPIILFSGYLVWHVFLDSHTLFEQPYFLWLKVARPLDSFWGCFQDPANQSTNLVSVFLLIFLRKSSFDFSGLLLTHIWTRRWNNMQDHAVGLFLCSSFQLSSCSQRFSKCVWLVRGMV